MPLPLPEDYLYKVYAGVLGKAIGVYLGRPFEGWTHERILAELGPIRYFVDEPVVVVDDDVSGTFVFVRALQEHGIQQALSSEAIGKTWLNNVIERRAVFWWGGNGISTEHTAFLNLKKRQIAAPLSGSILTNGRTIAEQIGAQIFIDGWAMVAPGNPALAARLAEAAARVSHDGEAVHAAKLLAVMEAEAFLSKDVNHLLDVGLKFVPADSLVARLVNDILTWAKSDCDWKKTRKRIEDTYGYDKFGGICHVIPNHGLIILALLYGGHDFHTAMHIVNTCGWDTDCNSGNVGCLVALMHGLDAFDGGPDWRGPVADRIFISSADGGYSINNPARIAYDIANLGRQLAGETPLPAPKDGAQFHFTLPGSVQGFRETRHALLPDLVRVEQALDDQNLPGLAIRLHGLTDAVESVEALTPTFTPAEAVDTRTYELMASPLVYPGQRVEAVVRAEKTNAAAVNARLRLKVYGPDDGLHTADGPSVTLQPGQEETLVWTIPDRWDSQPIQQLGVALSVPEGASGRRVDGTVWLDRLGWKGPPRLTLQRPQGGHFWHRAWVNGASTFQTDLPGEGFCIAQDSGEGIITYGTREWADYMVTVPRLVVNLGTAAGVAVRVQGLNRYYALMLLAGPPRRIALVKARDEQRIELASIPFDWMFDTAYEVSVTIEGWFITGRIQNEGPVLHAICMDYSGGGIGLVVTDGSVAANQFDIAPVR